MMDWKICGKKSSLPDFIHHSGIFLEGMMKTSAKLAAPQADI
jgi:hypothetical protein